MKIHTKTLEIETQKEFELIKITEKIKQIVEESNIKNGLVNIFSKHTTLAIKINEYEEFLLKDIRNFLEENVPKEKEYFHDQIELRDCPEDEPKNAEGHLRCLLLETSQTVPILNGKLNLGQFQDILAVETSGPRKRELVIQIIGD